MEQQKIIRIAAWTLVIAGVAYGAVKLFNHFRPKPKRDPMPEPNPSGQSPASEQPPAASAEDKFDTKKVVKAGDRNREVGGIQMIFNNVIDDMKKVLTRNYLKEGDNAAQLEAWKNDIRSTEKLPVTGYYGDKTKTLAMKIMGKEKFSFEDAQAKRKQIALRYGLKNPYSA